MKGELHLVDEKGKIKFMKALKEEEFDRILRVLELTPDEKSLETLDKVISDLEAPKKEIAYEIAEQLRKAKDLKDVFAKALMVLPLTQLKEMHTHVEMLEFERKPDCLLVKAEDRSWRLPI